MMQPSVTVSEQRSAPAERKRTFATIPQSSQDNYITDMWALNLWDNDNKGGRLACQDVAHVVRGRSVTGGLLPMAGTRRMTAFVIAVPLWLGWGTRQERTQKRYGARIMTGPLWTRRGTSCMWVQEA